MMIQPTVCYTKHPLLEGALTAPFCFAIVPSWLSPLTGSQVEFQFPLFLMFMVRFIT